MEAVKRLAPWIAVLAVVIVGIVAFTLMGEGADATTDPDVVVLHRGNDSEPSSLDPHRFTGVWENRIASDMFIGLFTVAADGTIINGMATDEQISDDGLVHTFTLRDDIVWSDGEPFTAHDFVYSYRRMVNPETAAEFASFLYVIENARAINFGEIEDPTELGVRAIDDYTLEITLERPHPFFYRLAATFLMFPVPAHVVEEYGDQWIRAQNIATNGAYILDEHSPNNYVRLVRNPLFWDNENVAIDVVYYYPTDDDSAALRRFRAGELDLNMSFPEQQIEWLRQNLADETRVYASDCVGYIVTNTEREPFDDVRVRQALAMSIDRHTLTGLVLRMGEEPAYSIVNPLTPDYDAPEIYWQNMSMDERRTLAREMLAEAGFNESRPLRFTYRYRESIKNRRAAIAVADMWSEIGVQADLVNTETAIHYDDLRAGNFQVADAGWCALFTDPAEYLLLVHSDWAELNSPNYYNPEFDAPYNAGLEATDAVTRNRLMAEAEAIMLRDMPLIPTYFYVNKALVGQHVQGFIENADDVHHTRWMSIDEDLRPEQASFGDRLRELFN